MEEVLKVLKKFSGALSPLRKSICLKKIKHLGHWVDFAQQGDAHSYYWLAIRTHKYGEILKIRKKRGKLFSDKIDALLKEKASQESNKQENSISRKRSRTQQLKLI